MTEDGSNALVLDTSRTQWKLVTAMNMGPANLVLQFVPSDQSGFQYDRTLWFQRARASTDSVATTIEQVRGQVESLRDDGHLEWSVMETGEREALFAWSLEGDTFRRDWSQLEWLVSGDTSLERMYIGSRTRPDAMQFDAWREEMVAMLAAVRDRPFKTIVGRFTSAEGDLMDAHRLVLAKPLDAQNRERQMASCAALLEFAHTAGVNHLAFTPCLCRMAECLLLPRELSRDDRDRAVDMTKHALELMGEWPEKTGAIPRMLLVLGRAYEVVRSYGAADDSARAARAYQRAFDLFDPERDWPERDEASLALGRLMVDVPPTEEWEPSRPPSDLDARAPHDGAERWGRRQQVRVRAHLRRAIAGDASSLDVAFSLCARAIDRLFDSFVRISNLDEKHRTAVAIATLMYQGQLACRAKLGLPTEDFDPNSQRRGFVLYLRRPDLFSSIWRPGEYAEAQSMIQLDDETQLRHIEVSLAATLEHEFIFAPFVENPSVGGYGTDPRPTWQFPLERMLRDARHIFIVLDAHVDDWWMLHCIVDNALQRKCVFIAPPVADDSAIEHRWPSMTQEFAELGVQLPSCDRSGLLFRVDEAGLVGTRWPFNVIASPDLAETLDRR